MKKIIFSLIISLLFLNIVIAQPAIPCPVAGRISGQTVGGLTVTQTNLRSGDQLIFITTDAGEFLVDWANAPNSYFIGDEIEIIIEECKGYSECKTKIKLIGDPIFVEFDVAGLISPVYPTTVPTTTTVPCPTTVPIATTVPCEDCPKCEDCTNIAVAVGVIASIIGPYVGIKIYTKRTGEKARLHKHPGIIAYHDPNVSHRNLKIRHPKGKWAPKYKKDTSGKWYYVGE